MVDRPAAATASENGAGAGAGQGAAQPAGSDAIEAAARRFRDRTEGLRPGVSASVSGGRLTDEAIHAFGAAARAHLPGRSGGEALPGSLEAHAARLRDAPRPSTSGR